MSNCVSDHLINFSADQHYFEARSSAQKRPPHQDILIHCPRGVITALRSKHATHIRIPIIRSMTSVLVVFLWSCYYLSLARRAVSTTTSSLDRILRALRLSQIGIDLQHEGLRLRAWCSAPSVVTSKLFSSVGVH